MRTKIIENQNDNSNNQSPKSQLICDTGVTGVAYGTFTPTLNIFGIGGYNIINLLPLNNTTTNKDIIITNTYSNGFPSAGLILVSPNGTQFRFGVLDNGEIWSAQV
jgi:hypothetical protein